MMTPRVPIDQLQRAAPIVSGFLLGYVAMLPLIGRIADLRGRVPVLVMSLVVFAVGSLVTALAYDLPSMVAGRFLQGVGGGGLVPATLALVADLYPAERRGVPLGRRLGGPGARQRARPALRRGGAGLRRLAGDLRGQPGGRAGAGRGDPGGAQQGLRRTAAVCDQSIDPRIPVAAPATDPTWSAARSSWSPWWPGRSRWSSRRRCCATSPGASCSSRSSATAGGSPRSA